MAFSTQRRKLTFSRTQRIWEGVTLVAPLTPAPYVPSKMNSFQKSFVKLEEAS